MLLNEVHVTTGDRCPGFLFTTSVRLGHHRCTGQEKTVYFIIGGILLISYREKYLKGARKGGLEEGVGKGRKLLPSNDTWR